MRVVRRLPFKKRTLVVAALLAALAAAIATQPPAQPVITQETATLPADFIYLDEANTTATQVQAAASIHSVTLVLAKWSGLTTSEDSTTLKNELTSLINNQVSDYWNSATNGRVAFNVDNAYGFITTTHKACDAGVQDAGAFWDEVATKVGFTSGPNKHLVVWFPQADCGGTSGLGTVGGSGLSGGGWVWVNGSKNRSLFAHELGHNFGLGHANTINCSVNGTRVSDASIGSCTSKSYADLTDVMGISHTNIGALNPRNLQTLGMLTAPDVIDITASQQVSLKPLSSAPSSSPRVARLSLNGDTYYVVVRTASGLDSWLSPTLGNGDPGVAIYRAPATWDARASYLMDADPQTTDSTYSTTKTILDQGQSVRVQSGAFTITATSVTSSGATISFTTDSSTPVQPAPTASPTPVPTVTITPTPTPTPTTTTGTPANAATITQTALYSGALAKYGSTWTAPLYVAWTTLETPVTQYLDNKSVINTAKRAVTRLNLASNTTADDIATLTVNTPNLSGTTQAPVMGLIRTDDPQAGKVVYAGTWAKSGDSYAHNSYVRRSSKAGSKVTVSTSGRSVGVVATKGLNRAVVDVYVNGIYKATINTENTLTKRGQVIWRSNYASAAQRTITLVHKGSGYFDFDGVIELY